MMKVAHWIIASLVIPRKERSTISVLVLKILYAMAHRMKTSYLITDYFFATNSSGIISLFVKSAPVRTPYPENDQPLPGDPYLTMVVLESIQLFRLADSHHHWTVGQNHDPKLLITSENRNTLALKRPTNFIYWKITRTFSSSPIPVRNMRKVKKLRRMAMMIVETRNPKIFHPWVVPAHSMMLVTRHITNNT
ncbi:unnamed protein product [Lactuca saligna]|uniref:Uncharacterized protein n=1 Tax=Lactuca saligna TaxID=75948 RepID=A0AA35ZGW0_LACSI|nr:unnamed protein product [Lactuca saligna]